VVYVPDASRSVPVAQQLISPDSREKFVTDLIADYERVRLQHAGRKGPALVTLAEARANKPRITWAAKADDHPDTPGVHPIGARPPAQTQVHRPARVPQLRSVRDRPLHRLGAVLPDLGPAWSVSGDPQ
jgi:hypothetical protein